MTDFPPAEQFVRDVMAVFEDAKAVGAEWGFVPDTLLLSEKQVHEYGWEDIAVPADGMVWQVEGPLGSWQDMLPTVDIPEFDVATCSCRWLECPAMRLPDSGCHRHAEQWPQYPDCRWPEAWFRFPRSAWFR